MLNGKLNGKLSSIIWAFPRLRRGRAATGSAIASASPGGESAPAAAGAPSASLTRSRRAEKTARPALALIAALLLSGCPGDLLKQMDNPRDPQAPSYQGFSTVRNADDIEAHTPDGAKLMFQTFIVSEVLDADAYQLQIAPENGFTALLYDNDSLDSNVMKGWASLTEETSYYWRGRAKKDRRWGPWTGKRAFVFTNTMSGLRPASGSTTTDTTPALSWDAVYGAAGYEVQIAASEAGLANSVAIDVTEASYTPATALTNLQTHYWRVRAKDGDGQAGSWSAEHSLNVVDDGSVYVEGGTFQMGSTAGDDDEEPVHQVTVSTFYMSRYEVTHGQYLEFLNGAGVSAAGRLNGNEVIDMDDSDVAFSHDGTLFSFSGSGVADSIDCPVMEVTWYGAAEYANWLSAESGLTKVYTINGSTVTADWSASGYRLPTEAEWEYAARGGNASKGYLYAGSDNADEVGWYSSNSGQSTHPVGGKAPNELGLYDMSGNVFEWCWDWYGSYSSGSQSNPRGPASGSSRVNRGGSWINSAWILRSAYRNNFSPGNSINNLGFRLVRREF